MEPSVMASKVPLRTINVLLAGLGLLASALVIAEEAELTWDGLVELPGTRLSRAWIMPDIDIASYTKMRVAGAGIHYRPVAAVSSYKARSGRVTDYPISEKERERLQAIALESFTKELAKTKRFELVDSDGPNTVILRGALLDVVSYMPPEPVGRSETYVSVFGEATLAVEMLDSMSNTVIARAVSRRAAETPGGQPRRANAVTGTAEVRRLFTSWAIRLRKVLDEVDSIWAREAGS